MGEIEQRLAEYKDQQATVTAGTHQEQVPCHRWNCIAHQALVTSPCPLDKSTHPLPYKRPDLRSWCSSNGSVFQPAERKASINDVTALHVVGCTDRLLLGQAGHLQTESASEKVIVSRQ